MQSKKNKVEDIIVQFSRSILITNYPQKFSAESTSNDLNDSQVRCRVTEKCVTYYFDFSNDHNMTSHVTFLVFTVD